MNGTNIPKLALIVAIIGVIILTATFIGINVKPHYEVSVSPFSGEINPGEEINSTIIVQKGGILPIFFNKKSPLTLATDPIQTGGISVKFDPVEGIPDPLFSSKFVISVLPNATNCSRLIPIYILDEKQEMGTAFFNLRIGRGEYGEPPVLPSQNGGGPRTTISMSDYYYPSGWMGDISSIEYYPVSANVTPHTDKWNIEIKYSPKSTDTSGWSGIYWQYPDNNWGTMPGAYDLSKFTRLTFWARGKYGEERAEFKVGGLSDGNYPDSLQPAATTQPMNLTNEWTKYTIDLTGKDLSRIGGGFVWVSNRASNPEGCTIYLDDIQFEK